MEPLLIGLAGPARSGKSTAANILAWGQSLRLMGFADPIRFEVLTLFGLDAAALEKRKDEAMALRVRPSDLTEQLLRHVEDIEPRAVRAFAARSGDPDCGAPATVQALLGCSADELLADLPVNARVAPRTALRAVGDFGRSLDPYLYLHAAGQALAAADQPSAVFHDLRLEIEAQWIRERSGWVVHIQRPGVDHSNEHPTEHGVRHAPGDLVVVNPGTIPAFRGELMHALSAMRRPRRTAGGGHVA